MHEYFDWNHLINEQSRNRMCNEVAMGIKAGKFWHNSPKFQTNWNVFGSTRHDFVNLKMSFIWSCFAYLQREVKIKQIQSWSFMTSLKHAEDRDTLWHHHNHNKGHWMIYPGKIWHRPGIVQSHEDRYIVAADMEF